MSREYPKLNNAPITEVVIGISCDDLFKSVEDIDSFISKFTSITQYKETETIHTVSFEVNSEEMKLGKNITLGSVISSEDKKEQIQLELNKLMFIDRNKYTTFDNFIKKFSLILKEVLQYKKSNIEIKDVGLRYINKFLFSNEKLHEKFLTKQTIITKNESEEFAKMKNSLFISHIKSLSDESMIAIIKTVQDQVNSASANVIFDIDTHINKEYVIDDVDIFITELAKLKEFKNQIFFSNFRDIHDIEEFQ